MHRVNNNNKGDLNSLINAFFNQSSCLEGQNSFKTTRPATNIVELDKGFSIALAAPGLEKDDFHIKAEKGTLTISAEKEIKLAEGEKQLNIAFDYSRFKRSFDLPKSVDASLITAAYNEGILTLELPKKPEEQSINKQIKIK